VRPLIAQLRAELMMTLRRGESLLLAIGIPAVLLVFFSAVDVLPTPDGTERRVDFLAPGVLALAVLSAAFTGPAIATAFERQYGVLKRIGTTPLGRPRLLIAKTIGIAVIEVLQIAVLVGIAMLFGWRPDLDGTPAVIIAVLLATAGFCGLALLIAGTLRAEAVLAGANALHIVLLLFSGLVFPLDRMPGALSGLAKLLPSTALAEVIRGAFDAAIEIPARAWLVLVMWAIVGPALAVWRFRWE
jgi:ABC-2 type transport system permease protein